MTRTASIADDERGRVPFALVAVVLLLGSVAYAVELGGRTAGGADPDVPAAMDRANAATETLLSTAVANAARRAARDPVVTPADTAYGRALDDDTPFRDYLRVRIYVAARRTLTRVDERVGRVRASASLPPVETPRDLRAAIDRVDLDGNGDTLDVRIQNVSITATRGGRVVARERRNVSVTVRSPVLAVHDRVQRFQRRLDRGPLDGQGLGRRLTARLYALAWARGYAYYAGAPFENVVSNRHVELMTNGAVLDTQRAVFGSADHESKRATSRATVQVGLRDMIAPAFGNNGYRYEKAMQAFLRVVLPKRSEPWTPVATTPAPPDAGHTPEERALVGINETADRAFLDLVDDGGTMANIAGKKHPSLDRILKQTYAATARRTAVVETVNDGIRPPPNPPGEGWTYDGVVGRSNRTNVTGSADVGRPSYDEWTVHHLYGRRVVRTNRVVWQWHRGNETATTVGTWRDVYRVGIVLSARHVPAGVPDRWISNIHERGGPLGGRNLAGVPAKMAKRLVTHAGGADRLARRAVEGEDVHEVTTIKGERPDGFRQWVYDDLASLRERVRNVTARVPRGSILRQEGPADALRHQLRLARSRLLDVPERYRSVADKVRVVARAVYIRQVLDRLTDQAEDLSTTRAKTNESLTDRGGPSMRRIRRTMVARRAATRSAGRIPDGRGGVVRVRVDGEPSYLTLATVGHDRVPEVPEGVSYRPLVARNVNFFTYPYGDAADTVVQALFDSPDMVHLRTAALALRRANRSLERIDNRTIANRRDALQSAVSRTVTKVRASVVASLVGVSNVSGEEAKAGVRAAFDRWETTHGLALAVVNGSAAGAVTEAVTERADVTARERDQVRVWTRTALYWVQELRSARPPEGVTNRSATVLAKAGRRAIKETVTVGMENATERIRDKWFGDGPAAVPTGLPVTPVPGSWYATTNVWQVAVKGEYARFTVRTIRSGRLAGVTGLQYTRDGGVVRLDVDGDGSAERLGRASRVGFSVETTVAVVVPPGARGVGDTDGNADERSKGWPDAGVVGDGGWNRPGNATGTTGEPAPSQSAGRTTGPPSAMDIRRGPALGPGGHGGPAFFREAASVPTRDEGRQPLYRGTVRVDHVPRRTPGRPGDGE